MWPLMISAGAAFALRFVRPPEVASGDDPEFTQVLRIADPAAALAGPLTFLPAAALPADAWFAQWDSWRTGLFAKTLAPALESAARHAALGQAREIRDLDLALAATLPPTAAARSAAAGRHLYAAMDGVKGERWLNKLQAWSADGSLPAQFAVAYACRYGSFHLPGRLLLPTYAYWEWTAARAARPPARGTLPDFAASLPDSIDSETALRVAGAE